MCRFRSIKGEGFMVTSDEEEAEAEFEAEFDLGNKMAKNFQSTIFDVCEAIDLDPFALTYDAWVWLSRSLVSAGWKPEELLDDLRHHAEDQAAFEEDQPAPGESMQ